jgi:hypothetical protein
MRVYGAFIGRLATEFAVIVLGVLVALALESYWEDRQERRLELEYLQRLVSDFHDDYLRIENARKATQVQHQHIENALEILDDGTRISPDDLLSVFMASRSVWSREIGATFQELFGTGQLRLVRNGELRNRLVDFYSYLSIAIVAAPGLEDRMPYRNIVRGEISPNLQEAIRGCGGEQSRILALPDTNMVMSCDFGAQNEAAADALDRIRQNPEAIRSLRRWAAAFTALRSRLDDVTGRIEGVEKLVLSEIERH